MTETLYMGDIWETKKIYDDAEISHFERLAKKVKKKVSGNLHMEDDSADNSHYEQLAKNVKKEGLTPLADQVARVRRHLIESRDTFTSDLGCSIDTGSIKFLEKKVVEFEKSLGAILKQLDALDSRVLALEKFAPHSACAQPINIGVNKKLDGAAVVELICKKENEAADVQFEGSKG